jgi:hypothetical protein
MLCIVRQLIIQSSLAGRALKATIGSVPDGHPNCPRRDGQILGFGGVLGLAYLVKDGLHNPRQIAS